MRESALYAQNAMRFLGRRKTSVSAIRPGACQERRPSLKVGRSPPFCLPRDAYRGGSCRPLHGIPQTEANFENQPTEILLILTRV
jgi:hypothetical protein